jgi:hypothetical protein
MTTIGKQLDTLEGEIANAAADFDAPRLTAGWRAVLAYFEEVSKGRTDPEPADPEAEYTRLWEAAKRAMSALGGQAEPALHTVADYDSRCYGPMLGVSDEGSATAAIRHGALASPKCSALAEHTPLTVGVAHDAERLGAVGEVIVGPDEYATIRLASRGRLLTTTNVGTRVNIRNFLTPPAVRIPTGQMEKLIEAAAAQLKKIFAPFVRTPSGRGRSLTAFIRFDHKIPARQRGEILRQLQARRATKEFCLPKRHRLGLLVQLTGGAAERVRQAREGIDRAGECAIGEVALDGPVLESARAAISAAGLLNQFEPKELAEVLQHAQARKVRISARMRVDPQTTARHVWTGLAVARNMGIELGKYGLVPLTFEEQKEVIARIQYWFPYWCAAPVYYVDYPLVTQTDVYHGKRLVAGIRRWLEMVAKLKVRVVLIDTANKAEGRRLLKESSQDEKGHLTTREISRLTEFAQTKRVKVLWAGGVTMPQAFEFGRIGVFGIYVTSAAASLAPVGKKYRLDPYLAGSREPQSEAVARVKLLLEAGFHVGLLENAGDVARAAPLAAGAHALLGPNQDKEIRLREADLHPLVVQAWKEHFAAHFA